MSEDDAQLIRELAQDREVTPLENLQIEQGLAEMRDEGLRQHPKVHRVEDSWPMPPAESVASEHRCLECDDTGWAAKQERCPHCEARA